MGRSSGCSLVKLAGDAVKLLAVWQRVLQDDKELFQFDGDLDDGRQHDQEGTLLLAGDELRERRLHDFGVVQEAMEVV